MIECKDLKSSINGVVVRFNEEIISIPIVSGTWIHEEFDEKPEAIVEINTPMCLKPFREHFRNNDYCMVYVGRILTDKLGQETMKDTISFERNMYISSLEECDGETNGLSNQICFETVKY